MERVKILPSPLSWAYFLDIGERQRRLKAGYQVVLPPEGVDAQTVTDTAGVVHVALTVPWPGKPGFIISFRGTLCPTCEQPRIGPHPPWVVPVVTCNCPQPEGTQMENSDDLGKAYGLENGTRVELAGAEGSRGAVVGFRQRDDQPPEACVRWDGEGGEMAWHPAYVLVTFGKGAPGAGRHVALPVVPEVWPAVAEGFTGACLIEVTPDERSGRGRYWRAGRSGYTDTILHAGIYTAEEALRIAAHSDRSYAVDAVIALGLEAMRLDAMFRAVRELASFAQLTGRPAVESPPAGVHHVYIIGEAPLRAGDGGTGTKVKELWERSALRAAFESTWPDLVCEKRAVMMVDDHDGQRRATYRAVLLRPGQPVERVAVAVEIEMARWVGSPDPVLSVNEVVRRADGEEHVTRRSIVTLEGTKLPALYEVGSLGLGRGCCLVLVGEYPAEGT